MTKWYGHTINVNIENELKFPKFNGRLSFVNNIINDETNKLTRKLNYLRSQISYQIGLESQILQKKAITDLDAVRSGRLRESVRITGTGLQTNIGTDLFYAEVVHDKGYSSGIPPRPWSQVAAGEVARQIDEIVIRNLNKIF